jgi:flagellar hook-associated protein 1 FlgK
MEPSDTGFSALMDNFWNSWQDLSANPDDQAARVAVREQANLMVNAFHHFAEQLKSFQKALDEDIQKRVLDINNIAYQLAALNDSITTAELTGHSANDLRDRRDYLVDELSRYVNVQVIEQPTGAYSVLIGSMVLVDRNEVIELETVVEEQGVNVVHNIRFKSSKIQPEINKGELAGLIEVRDEIVPERFQELDELAISLVERLNQLHREGYGLDGVSGRDFFDASTTGAEDIKLDDMVIQSEGYIAASLNGEIGDNSNALRIAALRTDLTMRGGTATFGDYYNSIVGIVGVRTREAQNIADNQESLVFHIENNRQAVEGVSLDEEMANMIKYQHAYEAAARVITTMDEVLDTIINGMGIVGR